MLGELSFAVPAALLIGAAAWDVLRRKVPNAFPVALLAAGLIAQGASGGARGAGFALVTALGLGAILTVAWSARALGGGDVKLGAAAAAVVGWHRLPVYLLATAVLGGLVALACYAASAPLARARVRATLGLAAHGVAAGGPAAVPGKVSVPYAAAMATGALTALVWGG